MIAAADARLHSAAKAKGGASAGGGNGGQTTSDGLTAVTSPTAFFPPISHPSPASSPTTSKVKRAGPPPLEIPGSLCPPSGLNQRSLFSATSCLLQSHRLTTSGIQTQIRIFFIPS